MSEITKKRGREMSLWQKNLKRAAARARNELDYAQIVYLIIDCSGSMSSGNKMAQAATGAYKFAETAVRRGYEVGLIRFHSDAKLLLKPQRNVERIWGAASEMRATGSTNMAAAIRMAIQECGESSGERVVCIVTDGMPDNREHALSAAGEAKERGIDIMAVGTDDADKEFLTCLATRQELAQKVQSTELGRAVEHMAKLLPRS